MLKFMQLIGVNSLPWTPVCIGTVLGLAAAIAIEFYYLRQISVGIHIHLGILVSSILAGGFLGICWHVVAGVCRFTLAAS